MNMSRPIVLSLSLLLAPAAVHAQTPYEEWLVHVVGSSEIASELAGGAEMVAWATDELEWVMASDPDECYMRPWSEWLVAVVYSQAIGISIEAGDVVTGDALLDLMEAERSDLPDHLAAATIACSS